MKATERTNRRLVATVALALLSGSCGAVAEDAPTAAPITAATNLPWEPHWPIGFNLPDELAGKRPAKAPPFGDVLVWTPPGAKRIRAVLLVPNNTDSVHLVEHEPVRRIAAKHEMGMVFFTTFDTGIEHRKEVPTEPDRIQRALDLVADKSGVAEFRHAPWITLGKSSRGEFPFRMAWLHPARTIAAIGYHSETPTWPVPDWAKVGGETIFHVNANGETEWGGTWFNHVRPALLNYRARKSWLTHQVVARGVGHGDYPDQHGSAGWGKPQPGRVTCLRVWDYLAVFMDKALERRLPKGVYPTKGPVDLQPVDEASGYLIDPFAVEGLFGISRMPLTETPDGFAPNPPPPSITGFVSIPPSKNAAVPEDVPVVRPDPAVQGFKEWLVTEFAPDMKADPMDGMRNLRGLTPKPGDMVEIDGQTLTFRPIDPKQVAPQGGILSKPSRFALLAYTVVEIPERRYFRLSAPFSPATRQQVVLNGVPVRHQQVVELAPGRYPLLLGVRMTVRWERIGPWFEPVSPEEVEVAKKVQAEFEAHAEAEAKAKAAGAPLFEKIIRPASEVPEPERKKMFWVADREQADAWFRLHSQPQ